MRIIIFTTALSIALSLNLAIGNCAKIRPIKPVIESMKSDERKIQVQIPLEKQKAKSKGIFLAHL